MYLGHDHGVGYKILCELKNYLMVLLFDCALKDF
jgi:hypothetical protein